MRTLNALFSLKLTGTSVTQLRLMRLRVERVINKPDHDALCKYLGKVDEWIYTFNNMDGWIALHRANLDKGRLFRLWENCEVEIQECSVNGEWRDVFVLEYPNKPPVDVT